MFDGNQKRRTFLKTSGVAGAIALAGCIGGDDDSGNGNGNGNENGNANGNANGNGDGNGDSENGNGDSTGNGSSSSVELTWLHDRNQAEDTLEEMAGEFNDSHSSIEVTPELLPSGSSEQEEIQKRQAAGNPPNILWYTFGQAYRYALEDKLAPITGVAEDNDLRTFTDREEKFFAVSIVGPMTWHYRTDLYDNPETFSDYLQQAQRIEEEEDIKALQFPNGESTLAFAMQNQLLWNNDVNVWAGSGTDIELAMASGDDRDRGVETYEWMQNAYEYSTNGNGLGWDQAATAYSQESTAAVPYIGMWIPNLYLADLPELRENTENAFFPVGGDADNEKKFAWFEGNMVWDTDAEKNDAAREFLQWWHAEEQQRQFKKVNAADYIPATEAGMNADWYREEDGVHQGMMDMFASEAENFTPPVATGNDGALNYPAVANGLVWGQAAAQLLHGGKSPGGTIDWAQDQIDFSGP
jgi:ABC-type glycerol-3-phosphate transport system substrate-binding protein